MTEVTVVFPAGGGVEVEDNEVCFQEASLQWRVGSFNKDVEEVQISFANGVDFFDGSHLSPKRGMKYSGAPASQYAEVLVYGEAPINPKSDPDYKTWKYTVTGFKSSGTNEEKDPEITVVRDIGGG
jgi:hypothetical protein